MFYNNFPISRALTGWFLSSIRGQMDKVWKLGLARAALCKWATCTRQICLSKIYSRYLTSFVKNKLTSVFYASVLLLMINCVITLSKWLWNHEPRPTHYLGLKNWLTSSPLKEKHCSVPTHTPSPNTCFPDPNICVITTVSGQLHVVLGSLRYIFQVDLSKNGICFPDCKTSFGFVLVTCA